MSYQYGRGMCFHPGFRHLPQMNRKPVYLQAGYDGAFKVEFYDLKIAWRTILQHIDMERLDMRVVTPRREEVIIQGVMQNGTPLEMKFNAWGRDAVPQVQPYFDAETGEEGIRIPMSMHELAELYLKLHDNHMRYGVKGIPMPFFDDP